MPYTIPVLSPPGIDDYETEDYEETASSSSSSEETAIDSAEEEDEDYVPIVRTNTHPRVSPNTRLNPARQTVLEAIESAQVDDRSNDGEGEMSYRIGSEAQEAHTICCPICMESWSSEDKHQVCCLPCGHVYGFSCIEKWLRQSARNSAKCPQCSNKCSVKDIIKLYVSRIAVVDGEQQKKLLSLQSENEFLKMKIASLQERISHADEEKMCKEASCLENVYAETQIRNSEFITASGGSQGHMLYGYTSDVGQGSSSCSFALEDEFVVEGARIFDMDACNRILVLARRLPGSGGDYVLTKISLMYPYDIENIPLPVHTKAVKDLHFSPSAGKNVLFASLGKKLSILSMESNNIVLTYNLPGPAWSCSWDLNSPHHVYAGLQNGMLLMFDIRQTANPVESMNGLSSHPVHTIRSLVHKSSTPCDARTLLSASSIGPCVWNTGGSGERRPSLVLELENQGVCVSLAYCSSTDDIVTSFRPKIQPVNDIFYTQPSISPTPAVLGRGILGSHVVIKRVGGNCYQKLGSSPANVNDVRMPISSVIVRIQHCSPLFAYGDEVTRGLSLCQLPSLRAMQNLEPHTNPILDVKFAPTLGHGLLGCTSEGKLQLFSAKLS